MTFRLWRCFNWWLPLLKYICLVLAFSCPPYEYYKKVITIKDRFSNFQTEFLRIIPDISEISIKSHRILENPWESGELGLSENWAPSPDQRTGEKIFCWAGHTYQCVELLLKCSTYFPPYLLRASPLPPYPHPPSQTLRLAASTSRRSPSTPNGDPFISLLCQFGQ